MLPLDRERVDVLLEQMRQELQTDLAALRAELAVIRNRTRLDIAARVLAGMWANPDMTGTHEERVAGALKAADTLIAAANEKESWHG